MTLLVTCSDCGDASHWGDCAPVTAAAFRMKVWAKANPHADTQGLTDDEWTGLAFAALDRARCRHCTDGFVDDQWVCKRCEGHGYVLTDNEVTK